MTSGGWRGDTGLSPQLQEAAREAARRAGMSVDEWLRATIGDSAAAVGVKPPRTGSIGGRLDQLSNRGGRGPRIDTPAFAHAAAPDDSTTRLAATVARLNERLDRLTTGRALFGDVDHRVSAVGGEFDSLRRDPSPSITPEAGGLGLDSAVAEISARQRALDESERRIPGTATSADLANLQAQLRHMSEQIETLRQPGSVEDALAGLRRDLGDIATTINEAMPRRALEALQGEVHALAERIDHGYGQGADPSALASIEQALGHVVDAINSMTPAEGLGSFEQHLRDLSGKIDGLAGGAAPDPSTLRALQNAIDEMRGLAAHVASAEGLASLSADVHALADRIDGIATTTGAGHLESLAERVDALTRALDARGVERLEMPQNLQSLVHALSDKLDQTGAPPAGQMAFDQLERQIIRLADKIEVADQRFGNINSIERGITQLMSEVQAARADAAAVAERVARSVANENMPAPAAEVSTLKHEIASLQANQSQTDRRTQDTLEAVHDTLERLVDRLAMVETDIRTEAPTESEPMRARAAVAAMPQATPIAPATKPAAPVVQVQRRDRPPIDPDLPADTPLEPGIGVRARTPAERIAASEAALSPIKRENSGEPTGKANFIAAARRAAQAAASEGAPVESARPEEGKDDEAPTSRIGRYLGTRRRALMIGVTALLLIYGTMQLLNMNWGTGERAAEPARPGSSQNAAPAPEEQKLVAPATVPPVAPEPARPEPAPVAPGRQSATTPDAPFMTPSAPLTAPVATTALITPTPVQSTPPAATPAAPAPADITGSIPRAPQPAPVPAPKPVLTEPPLSLQAPSLSDKALPASIGGPALRTAATSGNAGAEYEIGLRYAEGRGVTTNLEVALQWFERAANQGLAPAQYRLGSMYEKGQGVRKDLNKARELYLAAADKGNAKAIHNLAVLYAEGIDGKPDYRAAAQWFRKAAERGVADSQYNLGILYARGIGVDQNLAESYKWFSLAANQGDQDSAKKRDDVAARLDQQSLVAARLAVQTFTVDPPPEEAMNVKPPAGGWDRATAAPAKAIEPRRKGST